MLNSIIKNNNKYLKFINFLGSFTYSVHSNLYLDFDLIFYDTYVEINYLMKKFKFYYKPYKEMRHDLTILFLLAMLPLDAQNDFIDETLTPDARFKIKGRSFVLEVKARDKFSEEKEAFSKYKDFMKKNYANDDFILLSFSNCKIFSNVDMTLENAKSLSKCFNSASYITEIVNLKYVGNFLISNSPVNFLEKNDEILLILNYEKLFTKKDVMNSDIEKLNILDLNLNNERLILSKFLDFRSNMIYEEREHKNVREESSKFFIMKGLIETNMNEIIIDIKRVVNNSVDKNDVISSLIDCEKLFFESSKHVLKEFKIMREYVEKSHKNEKMSNKSSIMKEEKIDEKRIEKMTEKKSKIDDNEEAKESFDILKKALTQDSNEDPINKEDYEYLKKISKSISPTEKLSFVNDSKKKEEKSDSSEEIRIKEEKSEVISINNNLKPTEKNNNKEEEKKAILVEKDESLEEIRKRIYKEEKQKKMMLKIARSQNDKLNVEKQKYESDKKNRLGLMFDNKDLCEITEEKNNKERDLVREESKIEDNIVSYQGYDSVFDGKFDLSNSNKNSGSMIEGYSYQEIYKSKRREKTLEQCVMELREKDSKKIFTSNKNIIPNFLGMREDHINLILDKRMIGTIKDCILKEENLELLFILFYSYKRIQMDMMRISCLSGKYMFLSYLLHHHTLIFEEFKELSIISMKNGSIDIYRELRFSYDLYGQELSEIIKVNKRIGRFTIY